MGGGLLYHNPDGHIFAYVPGGSLAERDERFEHQLRRHGHHDFRATEVPAGPPAVRSNFHSTGEPTAFVTHGVRHHFFRSDVFEHPETGETHARQFYHHVDSGRKTIVLKELVRRGAVDDSGDDGGDQDLSVAPIQGGSGVVRQGVMLDTGTGGTGAISSDAAAQAARAKKLADLEAQIAALRAEG
jgi:hypothetical protein